MADVTAGAATATAAGISALILTSIGVEPQSVIWAAVGAGAGTAIAPGLGRWKAMMVFVCTILLCALWGTWVAQHYQGSNVTRNLVGCATAFVFHPIVSAIVNVAVTKIPEIFDGALKKAGLK